MMHSKLHVKDLTISFKTREGKVQAVRNINFDLQRGETLAIVGESGSGKSVTSKAILGILAGNSIVESGEILYDGKDLLKISEDEFHEIRGDKIAMIFQDPMSSLNPITKVGKQLTEAMLLKGKARQKESRTKFNTYLATLENAMKQDMAPADAAAKCKKFDTFESMHCKLEAEYNRAVEAAQEAVSEIEDLSFEISKKAGKDVNYRINMVRTLSRTAIHRYVVDTDAARLRELADRIVPLAKARKSSEEKRAELIQTLGDISDILKTALAYDEPNFFGLGYYVTNAGKPVPEVPVAELNAMTRKYLDEDFMLEFIDSVKLALTKSAQTAADHQKAAIALLREKRAIFSAETLDKKTCLEAFAEMEQAVKASIDPLAIVKDSVSMTFPTAFRTELNTYFSGASVNAKEEKKYARQVARQDKLKAKGKDNGQAVAAPSLVNFDLVKANMDAQIGRVITNYENALAAMPGRNYDEEAIAVIDWLKSCASGVIAKVTKAMAKRNAIRLMKEVGISDSRKRYDQYPFEFSGGMRQRIVIAIALAANPDILICDEPTTALDVTIQSQILELINKLKEERHLSVIFITHDLGVVANMADRIAVMYAGKIVEYGTAEDIFYESAHPYTWALLSSMPDLDTNEKLDAIPGTPPNMIYPPVGDAFAERNKYALKIDFEMQPPMFRISDTHYAATWLLHPDAPKVETPKAITDRINRMKQKEVRSYEQQ